MSERIAKLNSLVQQEVATILSRDVEFPRSFFVTVSRAEVSDDAENAKVWISVMPATHEEAALKIIKGKIGDIQDILNKRLVMKFVPKLAFHVDSSTERAAQITKILDSMTSTDLGLSLDAATVEEERLERDRQKEEKGLQPGQALNPREPRRR
jgi:ribosome-binding factor A